MSINISGTEEIEFTQERIDLGLELLSTCFTGNLEHVKSLISQGADAWLQDESGWTSLHSAAYSGNLELVEFLLSSSNAVWNMTDNLGYTAGDIAYSLNFELIYNLILEEGIRQELLKAMLRKMGMSEEDSSDEEDEEEIEEKEMAIEITPPSPTITPFEPVLNYANSIAALPSNTSFQPTPSIAKQSTAGNNKAYLKSKLFFGTDENQQMVCADIEGNGVMMGWEGGIMKASAEVLAGNHLERKNGFGLEKEFSVMNVGFGLGLIDSALQELKPSLHLIIEPHPDVLNYAKSLGWYEKPGVRFFEGTWQQFDAAVEDGSFDIGEGFDSIYFDTYSEHYRHLHDFFKLVPTLLTADGIFSFFHGLGATSRLFYDVYTEVSTIHLKKLGISTEWSEVDLSGREGGDWIGVERKYWEPIVGTYRLPMCKLIQK